jgi:hypothetical protein
MVTLIIRILFRLGLLKKAHSGCYYCDILNCRIQLNYLKFVKHQDPRDICGNWYGFTLFGWDIHWLIHKTYKKRKVIIEFP